jgi:hypothetical protein
MKYTRNYLHLLTTLIDGYDLNCSSRLQKNVGKYINYLGSQRL